MEVYNQTVLSLYLSGLYVLQKKVISIIQHFERLWEIVVLIIVCGAFSRFLEKLVWRMDVEGGEGVNTGVIVDTGKFTIMIIL